MRGATGTSGTFIGANSLADLPGIIREARISENTSDRRLQFLHVYMFLSGHSFYWHNRSGKNQELSMLRSHVRTVIASG